MPPPTQRWIRPSATASVRIVSASSKSPSGRSDAERAHRGAAADRLERGDQVDGRDLRRAGDRAAGEGRARGSRRARRPGRSVPSTVETRCVTPASSRWAISSGQVTEPGSQTRARSLRSRSTIITCSAPSFSPSTSTPAGRVPLIGEVTSRRAAAREEELGRGRDDRPAGPDERPRLRAGADGASASASAAGIAGERRGEMLDEIRLVDVAAARSRRARPRSRRRSRRRPSCAPTRRARSRRSRRARRRPAAPDAAGEQRQRARLGRRRAAVAAERRREAVAEVEVGDDARRGPRTRAR